MSSEISISLYQSEEIKAHLPFVLSLYCGKANRDIKLYGREKAHDLWRNMCELMKTEAWWPYVVRAVEEVFEASSGELFRYIHPAIDSSEALRIHNEVTRLVKTQKIPDICPYLKALADEKKILLPTSPSDIYDELVRLGMPDGEGYSSKYFTKHYCR